MADIIQIRRGTAAQWTSTNPILADGEIGFETDGSKKGKLGNGVTAWNSLPYSFSGDSLNVADQITAAVVKTIPVDADQVGITDSAASNVLKKLSWANIKATLKTYFDTFYESAFTKGSLVQGTNVTLTGTLTNRLVGTGNVTIAAAGGDVAASINAAPAKTVPADADSFGIVDSAASNVLKKLTWANIKTALNSLYAAVSHSHSAADIISGILPVARGGTGIGSYTTGNYINASGATTLQQRTPTQVREDISAEPAFTKGSLVQGANVTLSGTLANRLVGTGDVTIAAAVGSSFSYILPANRYYYPLSAQRSFIGITDIGDTRFTPFHHMLYSNVNMIADRIAFNVQIAGGGTSVRLGIFSYTNGVMTLVTDCGTVDTSTTGVKEVTINTTLEKGKVYMLALSKQGNSEYIGVTIGFQHISYLLNTSGTQPLTDDSSQSWSIGGITGAFGSSYTPTTGNGSCFLIGLRLQNI